MINGDEVLSHLTWRYATKKFNPQRKIGNKEWSILEQSMILAPSSYGLQPWKFVVVTDPEVRKKLHPVAFDQPQILDASHLVVFSSKKNIGTSEIEHYIKRIAEVRKTPESSLQGFKKMLTDAFNPSKPSFNVEEWAANQVFIALGFLLSSAAVLGIDACPMGGFKGEEFDKILGLDTEGYASRVICTLGYRDPSDPNASYAKVRFDPSDVVKNV